MRPTFTMEVAESKVMPGKFENYSPAAADRSDRLPTPRPRGELRSIPRFGVLGRQRAERGPALAATAQALTWEELPRARDDA